MMVHAGTESSCDIEADSEMVPNGTKPREGYRRSEKPYINRKNMDFIGKQGVA